MAKRLYIFSLLLLLGCTSPLRSGTVYHKIHIPAHFETHTKTVMEYKWGPHWDFFEGKMRWAMHPVHHQEQYQVWVDDKYYIDIIESERTRRLDVSKETYEYYNKDDYYSEEK